MARYQPAERDARYRKRRRAGYPVAVSEGDSWFDYPFLLNLIDRIDDFGLFAHLRLELSGDLAADMIGTATGRRNLRTVIEDARPMVVLFSGGGNDLAHSATGLFRKGSGSDPEDYLVTGKVDDLFEALRAAYHAMIREIGPFAPIFAHGYDWFAPSDRPVRFNALRLPFGPWIHPAMVAEEIHDEATHRKIGRYLIDRFNEMLADLADDHPLDFVHVDLRGTLDIDSDWENEIHPTRAGFIKVAEAFREALVSRLPDLLRDRTARDMVIA